MTFISHKCEICGFLLQGIISEQKDDSLRKHPRLCLHPVGFATLNLRLFTDDALWATHLCIDLQAGLHGGRVEARPIPTQRERPFYSYALTVNAKNQSVSFDFLFLCIPSEN